MIRVRTPLIMTLSDYDNSGRDGDCNCDGDCDNDGDCDCDDDAADD